MFHMSSAMGGAFAEAVTRLTQKIQELGPNPVKPSQLVDQPTRGSTTD
jgi:coenzyme F420-reducing hydrogenase delta subunit